MSAWQKRLGERTEQRKGIGTTNTRRQAHYYEQNGGVRLTLNQTKRILLKRGRETARNARRTWRRKRAD